MSRNFIYKSSGINGQGNHYCSRDYGPNFPNRNSYHYSNRDGSYYYRNPDGSTYYNNDHGRAIYTFPGGDRYTYYKAPDTYSSAGAFAGPCTYSEPDSAYNTNIEAGYTSLSSSRSASSSTGHTNDLCTSGRSSSGLSRYAAGSISDENNCNRSGYSFDGTNDRDNGGRFGYPTPHMSQDVSGRTHNTNGSTEDSSTPCFEVGSSSIDGEQVECHDAPCIRYIPDSDNDAGYCGQYVHIGHCEAILNVEGDAYDYREHCGYASNNDDYTCDSGEYSDYTSDYGGYSDYSNGDYDDASDVAYCSDSY
ncbi:hypothetical protein B0I35DRAFT_478534 [Stachybotrys elegans]|uniref:Uncharacterized protein n=1 Tax=Stachybotrys elegans TaxID=80388 RepID=A0A8K0SR61_9HYPO|nr:hypothetical protein B0I35DRAFT_478534 [Stachybotrys elegans]